MSSHEALDLDAITNAADNGGVAGLVDCTTEDIELCDVDQTTPPGKPAVTQIATC
jgi:hypothetical protein